MSEEPWRPLGVDSEDEVAEYDALHDGVREWLDAPYWAWVLESLTTYRQFHNGSGRVAMLNIGLAEQMCQTLKIALPNLRTALGHDNGRRQLERAEAVLRRHPHSLQVADYLLAHDSSAAANSLDAVLERGKSAWAVGTRSGRPGLVRRVPLGVQIAADSIMARAGRAGVRLADAWGQLYGLASNASEAYRLAILAVEDAVIPIVSPTNRGATLGTVLRQLEDQGDWTLSLEREHSKAPTGEVVVSMMRMLWHGQHDRHGGQPSAPGDVSNEEAMVAVGLAITLVHWFNAGLVRRST
ncbi:hypothetical protein [Candidatus Neomicrothrix sp.]|uniref:hypothetical protein n=1 Tax=Candidatus Neomicrothrix sp. TaxID=2719034 RepID=UPI0025958E9A|nr:hypothetical protein [Candidatus Microthrix sp.]HMS48710.1 hypothetical protein [Candidatus Microthrix sp.]